MKATTKNTYREIFRSPGRFIAILMIIILGSGFFVGLRVSQKGMLRTGEAYLESQAFYDFQLVSTLGLTCEDVDAFGEIEGVENAEGSFSLDALAQINGDADEYAYAFYSMPQTVNLPGVTEGRLPENDGECLADNHSGLKIGDVIRITESNDSDTLDLMAVREFTVVGLCNSPLYLNYERGGTSIGRGQISAFIYVDPGAFDADYYTCIYVRLLDMPDPYSDSYKDKIDALEPAFTALLEEQGDLRYNSIVDEANAELQDGMQEYQDALSEYQSEREDAEAELQDAWDELVESRQKLDEAREEISDGYAELEASEADARDELAGAEQRLKDALSSLDSGESEYSANLASFEDGKEQYAAGLAEYEAQSQALSASRDELDAARDMLSGQQSSFDTLMDALAAGIAAAGGPVMDGKSLLAALESGEPAAEAAAGQVLAAMAGSGAPGSVAELLAVSSELSAGWDNLNANAALLEAAAAELSEGKAALDMTARTLAEAELALAAAREALDSGWDEYEAGLQELENGQDELTQRLEDGYRELKDAEQELENGEAEYENGLAEYEDARAEAEKQFAEAEDELRTAQEELEDAKQEILELDRPTLFTLTRWSNVGFVCFDNDTAIVKSISSVFPVFFFLIAALICVTTVTRMVDEQRSQLGVLMALGYSRGAVMSKFLFYSGLATVVGSIAGILLGSWLIPLVVWQAYKIMYYFSDGILFTFDTALSLGTFVSYVAVMELVTWTSCRKELDETPAYVIRPKPPKVGKRVLLERLTFIWNHLSFMWKVALRNLFRYKQRALMMILGVAGCTALMITGFGIKDSISGVVDAQYSEITLYDMSVSFSEEPDRDSFLDALSGKGEAIFLHQGTATAAAGKKEKEVTINVFDSDSVEALDRYIDFHNGDTSIPFPGAGGVLINSALSETLGVGQGGTVTLRVDNELLTVTVEGVFDNYIYNYAILSAETWESQCGESAELNAAYVSASSGTDSSALAAELLGLDKVIAVSESDTMRSRIDSMLESLNYIVLLTIVCAAALAFSVIYNLTNINITERLREIATVKVLGFYDLESAAYVLRENIVMTFLGAAVGIPAGLGLTTFVMGQIKVDLISFVPRVQPMSYVYSCALTLFFSLLVDFFMLFRLKRINTAEALKAAE